MARISSYPIDKTIQDKDSWIGTESSNRVTRNFTAEDIANYVTTSTSSITGSGTLNTIAMFTPNGQAVGDSGITQFSPEIIKIGTGIAGGASVLETNLLTCNIISGANLLTIQGNSIIGNEATDILQITSSVSDYTGTASTTAGQVLVSNASSQLEWTDIADISGSVTGGGTLSTIAMFTPDGQKIGDSFIKQQVIAATNLVRIDGGGGFLNKFQSDEIQTSSLLTDNITSEGTGNVILKGGVIIGDQSTDILQITSKVSDFTGNGSTTAGEILVSNAAGQLVWDDATDVVSGAVAKLIPYLTTATPGGSETYTALNNIVKIGWSGGNGIYVINLPSATAIPYRVIRFVTNGTYPGGGAHKVRFTATGGETIDGAAFFETSKVYAGIAAWSTGTEWVIIQVKAH
jgi:hypothetical protein